MLVGMRLSAGRWADLVGAWEASGRSSQVFAAEHGVSEASLRWWRGELARRASSEPARRSPGPGRKPSRGVALARVVRAGEAPPLAPVAVKGPVAAKAPMATKAPAAPIVVVVGEARILVSRHFDPGELRAVVDALSGRRP